MLLVCLLAPALPVKPLVHTVRDDVPYDRKYEVEQSRISPSLDGKGMRLISMAQRYNGDKSLYWEAWFTCTGSFAQMRKSFR